MKSSGTQKDGETSSVSFVFSNGENHASRERCGKKELRKQVTKHEAVTLLQTITRGVCQRSPRVDYGAHVFIQRKNEMLDIPW